MVTEYLKIGKNFSFIIFSFILNRAEDICDGLDHFLAFVILLLGCTGVMEKV